MGLLASLQAKVILGLALGLAASLTGNFLLVRGAWIAEGERRTADKLEHAEAELSGYKTTEKVNTAIAELKELDTANLLQDLRSIAERGNRFEVRWRQAATAAPLPAECKPGQERMDSVNALLSGKEKARAPAEVP